MNAIDVGAYNSKFNSFRISFSILITSEGVYSSAVMYAYSVEFSYL